MSNEPALSPPDDDPRRAFVVLLRDCAVLVFLARAREASQQQVTAMLFRGLSPTVVTRCVKRLQALGLIVVNRLGTSINLLRLSYAGARYLEAEGLLPAADIHVPRKPTSLKDLAHSLSVVDTMIALELGFDGSRQLAVRPCWALRRALTGSRFHVPDIAAVTDDGKAALLVEVDYATEGLRELAPRLCELAQQAPLWLEASEIRILVLTIGTRRENSLRARLASLAPAVPITVAQLPPSSSTSIDALITILTNTSEVAPS